MGIFSKYFKRKSKLFQLSNVCLDYLVCLLPVSSEINLNSKIIVPENFCAVLLSKEKLLDIIPSGEYELTGLTIPKTCKINKLDKPTKNGYKTKFDADFYYVNKKTFNIHNNFIVNKLKQDIKFNLNITIENPIKFLKFLFQEKIVFDNDFALNELTFYTSQLIYYFLLDNKTLSQEKLENYLTKMLSDIGVKSSNLKINNFNNFPSNNSTTKLNGLNTNNDINSSYQIEQITTNENTITNTNTNTNTINFSTKSTLVSLDDIINENISYFTCDNCGVKLPQNAKYCFNCKKSFIEKNLCENCGRVIPNGVYVCPYCNSVTLK